MSKREKYAQFDHCLALMKQAYATRRRLENQRGEIVSECPAWLVTEARATHRRLSRAIATCKRREHRRHQAMGALFPLCDD